MNPYILLAKQAIETYIKERKIISSSFVMELLQRTKPPDDLLKEFLERKAGTFVTIEKNGKLRGCIGTYLPVRENIAEEIIYNAITAATEDYRFGPIRQDELPQLSYTVYILNKPELAKDLKELDPKKFGIIVKTQGFMPGSNAIFNTAPRSYEKTGLLLPDLEGIDTVEKQLWITCQKGGIDPQNEEIIIYKFTVEKHEEKN